MKKKNLIPANCR